MFDPAKLRSHLARTLNFLLAALALAAFGWAIFAELEQGRLTFPDPVWVLVAGLISLTIQIGETARVAVLSQLSPSHWAETTRISMMANLLTLLPIGWLGSDVFRAHKLSGMAQSAGHAVSGVAIARLMGMTATLLLFFLAGFHILADPPQLVVDPYRFNSTLITGLLILFGSAACILIVFQRFRERITGAITQLSTDVKSALKSLSPTSLGIGSVASFGIAVGRSALLWAIALSLGEPVGFAIAIAASGIGIIVSVAPFTTAGIGLREAAVAAALATLGVNLATAILVATSARLLSALVSLLGWVCLLPYGFAPSQEGANREE